MSPETATLAPKPHLARLLEAIAAILDLDEGQQRVELIFSDGHLSKFFLHGGPHGARALAEYDARAAALVRHLALDDDPPTVVG